MRKKILGFVFAMALLVALAVPVFGGVGTAEAVVHPAVPIDCAVGDSAGGRGPEGGLPGGPGPGNVAQGNANAPDPNPCIPE